jgi:hypothetical protein
MAERPLSSDRETALAPSAPEQRAPPKMPRARRRPWSGITLVLQDAVRFVRELEAAELRVASVKVEVG